MASAHLALCTKKSAICALTFQWKTLYLLCVSQEGNGEQGTQRAQMDMHVKLSVSNTFFFLLASFFKESFPTVWHMKNMLEAFKKDHQVRGLKHAQR